MMQRANHGEWLGDHLRFSKGYPADDAVSRVLINKHARHATVLTLKNHREYADTATEYNSKNVARGIVC